MDSKSDMKIGDKGMTELGIVTFDGREFSALGAVISETMIVCYPTRVITNAEHYVSFRTWGGAEISRGRITGRSRGFHNTPLEHFSTVYAGHYWHGKGSGLGMLLKLRRGRRVK